LQPVIYTTTVAGHIVSCHLISYDFYCSKTGFVKTPKQTVAQHRMLQAAATLPPGVTDVEYIPDSV